MKLSKPLVILAVLVLFCLSAKNSLTVTMNGGKATAVCVSEPRKTTRRSRKFLAARECRFRYTDENGDAHRASIWISLTRPKAGDKVEIIYAKDSPKLIYYDSILFVWMLPAILGSLLLFPLTKFFLRRTKSE
jgi:hypothetical protein